MKLYELSAAYKQVEEMLGDGTDNEAILDTLESIKDEITVKAQGICSVISQSDAYVVAIDNEIERLQSLKSMHKKKADWLKDYIKTNMENAGQVKIQTPTHVLSIKKNPHKLIIDDESLIPASYQEIIPQTYKVNSAAVKDDLKNGVDVPGAKLEQGTRLDIK